MKILKGKLFINDCIIDVDVEVERVSIHPPTVWTSQNEPFDIEEYKAQDEKKYEAMRIYNETFCKK